MIDNKNNNLYKILTNEIRKGYISHAYLIEENNNIYAYDMVIDLVKNILCLGLSDSEKNRICKRIDDGNYPELMIIRPDGMLIRKQQIIDLQREFSMEAVEGNRRVYIIRDCEKMRAETANSMLKFLEEPENNVVAFLMTNNINSVLDTIISRCQIIKLGNDNLSLSDNETELLALNFIDILEKKGKRGLVDIEKKLSDIISSKDREKLVVLIDKIIDMYYNIMKIMISDQKNNNILHYDELVNYINLNDINKLINKINCLTQCKDSIKYNVNINLLIDKLILSIGG